MSNTKQLIMVGLTQEQWDFLTTDLDVRHDELEKAYKKLSPDKNDPADIKDAKNHAHFLEEIIDEIADQIAGVTEEMEG